ncbi:hypothetical protein SRHO_G00156490 [Serrasalmus rhombeus]
MPTDMSFSTIPLTFFFSWQQGWFISMAVDINEKTGLQSLKLHLLGLAPGRDTDLTRAETLSSSPHSQFTASQYRSRLVWTEPFHVNRGGGQHRGSLGVKIR